MLDAPLLYVRLECLCLLVRSMGTVRQKGCFGADDGHHFHNNDAVRYGTVGRDDMREPLPGCQRS